MQRAGCSLGRLEKGERLHLVDALAETAVNQVSVDMGSLREEVSWVSAGNLASLSLTGEVKAGETLVDLAHKADMVPFEGISYVSEPVVTLAVEPKNPKDIPVLLEALKKLASEDPNLKVDADKQTGEYLLSGMGELHLEVAINQLKNSAAWMLRFLRQELFTWRALRKAELWLWRRAQISKAVSGCRLRLTGRRLKSK